MDSTLATNDSGATNRKWWTLGAVCVATFMLLLDITVVNTALPAIQRDLGGSFTDLQWVIDAYALSLAALVLTAGSLADRLGRRRIFAIGLGIFSVASLLCALAPDPTFLNLARGLQGVGGAVMFAVSLALVAQEFPSGPERGMAMGIYGGTIGIAVAVGRLGVGLPPQRADRAGGDRRHLLEGRRVPRPERDPDRLGRAPHLLQRAVPLGAGAGPR
jgi:MFS family permease